jgi:hypothetical protein
MNKKLLSDFAKSLLFENRLDEKFQPDDDMHPWKSGHQIYDRPGPMTGTEKIDFDDIVDMPLTADDMMSQQLAEPKVDADKLRNKDYLPTNQSELIKATSSLLNNIDLNEKDMEKFWRAISKFLNKRAD